MGETFEQMLAALTAKAEALADAHNHETQLEDDRAKVKAEAIERICIRDNLKATPAEKIVETDEGYAEHRAKQRASIIARFRADAEYEAAKAALTRAALITPPMAELITKAANSKRALELKEIELRRSNGWLADRIRDVEELRAENANLKTQLEARDREIDRLEARVDTGATAEPLV